VSAKIIRWKRLPPNGDPCPVCDELIFGEDRTRHLRCVPRTVSYGCNGCEARFASLAQLAAHRCILSPPPIRYTRARMSAVRKPCPACGRGERDKTLKVTTDELGTVAYCYRCLYTTCQNHERPHLEPVRTTSDKPLDWSEKAESIWRRTQPLRGTIGQTYLEHRGCVLPPADSHLRFLAGGGKYPSSLCAAVTDARSGKPISMHFTRLAADGKGKAGSEQDKLLLAGHRKKGGVIRLWPDEAVTYGLAIAEGIESALAAAHLHTPVWAAIDASNLAAFPVLNGIESLAIYADHDDVGLGAARVCARRWREASREVRIRRPRTPGWDPADVLKGMVA
jgi:putative DNA primase/helicase